MEEEEPRVGGGGSSQGESLPGSLQEDGFLLWKQLPEHLEKKREGWGARELVLGVCVRVIQPLPLPPRQAAFVLTSTTESRWSLLGSSSISPRRRCSPILVAFLKASCKRRKVPLLSFPLISQEPLPRKEGKGTGRKPRTDLSLRILAWLLQDGQRTEGQAKEAGLQVLRGPWLHFAVERKRKT